MSVRMNTQARAEFDRTVLAAVDDATEHLLEQANRTIPIETATMERSGQATSEAQPGRVVGVVSYDTPYAARQHEDTRLRHDDGRRAKWLEATMAEETPRVGKFIADRIGAGL